MRKLAILIALVIISSAFSTNCIVYFEGIGCPHCAKVDKYIFNEFINTHDTLVIEYEVYQHRENVNILANYISKFGGLNGVPQIYLTTGSHVGDVGILNYLKQHSGESKCRTLNGDFEVNDLRFDELPGTPRIWYKDRVVVVGDENISELLGMDENKAVFEFLFGNFTPRGENVTPIVSYSHGSLKFSNGVKVGDWYFYWGNTTHTNEVVVSNSKGSTDLDFNWMTIFGLALTDSINPCALAVLALMLITIMTYGRKNVLLAGLAFSFTVFVMYFVYGLLIVYAFQVVQTISQIRVYLDYALAGFAILLGVLQIKDYFFYKPGTPLTEMPLSLRPKVKKIISKITSPIGAVFLGAFVTLFLLPCTIGPYFIAGGLLSKLPLLSVLPYLIFYNAVFILPMIGITLAVYFGITTVTNVKEWRDKNIRLLHAIEGAIMIAIGVYLIWSLI